MALAPEAAVFPGALGSNPYPAYAQLRTLSPVTHITPMNLWAVSRYADVARVLRDPRRFSSVVGEPQLRGEMASVLLLSDPPVHTRLRRLVAGAFTPTMVARQRPAIERWSRELVEAMLAGPEPDIVGDLAVPLPVRVIAGMLGVADGDHAAFKRWSDDVIEHATPVLLAGDGSTLAATSAEFAAYFEARIGAARARPEDNILGALVTAEDNGGELTRDELLLFCLLLLVAGNETTTGLLVNAIRCFAEFPWVLERIRRNPSLLAPALEEVLRYYAPFQATFRRTRRAVRLAGARIPAGERLLVLLGSANRDATVFERPDDFVIDREPNRHLSFGMGIHQCVGAPLARLEARAALDYLVRRIRGVEILPDQDMPLLRPGGPRSLRVRFTPAA